MACVSFAVLPKMKKAIFPRLNKNVLLLPKHDVSLGQEFDDFNLRGKEKRDGASNSLGASCPSHSVDVVVELFGAVKLYHPVDLREV